jgi:hypothetical protein
VSTLYGRGGGTHLIYQRCTSNEMPLNVCWGGPARRASRVARRAAQQFSNQRAPSPPPYCCPYPCPYCTQARAAFHRADPPPLLRCSAARGAAWPLRWLRESSSSLRPLPQKLT